MSNKSNRCIEQPAGDCEAVGIVVQNGRTAPTRPRMIAFVWGGETQDTPSLPFGRWKVGFHAA